MTTNVYTETSNSEEQMISKKKAKETFKTFKGLRSKHSKNIFLGQYFSTVMKTYLLKSSKANNYQEI